MIGATLKTIITGNTTINAAIESRFRPVADLAEGLPAIYYIVRQLFNYNKLGQQGQTWRVTLLVIHNEYKAAWQLATRVKQAMEAKERQNVSGVLMQKVECQSIADEYDFPVEAYVLSVEFEIFTNTILMN